MAKVLNRDGAVAPEEGRDDPVAASCALLERALNSRSEDGGDMPGAGELRSVDPAGIEGDEARIAFWVNVYNTLLLAIQRERPFRGSVLLALRSFSAYAYEIGGAIYSLNLIEHGVLRLNQRPPSSPMKPLRRGDGRQDAAPSELDPRVHFLLNCGARSCPPIRLLNRETASDTLEVAARAYLRAETDVRADRGEVELPGLLKLYGADFGDEEARLHFAARYVPQLDALLESKPSPNVTYASFDWRVYGPERAPSA